MHCAHMRGSHSSTDSSHSSGLCLLIALTHLCSSSTLSQLHLEHLSFKTYLMCSMGCSPRPSRANKECGVLKAHCSSVPCMTPSWLSHPQTYLQSAWAALQDDFWVLTAGMHCWGALSLAVRSISLLLSKKLQHIQPRHPQHRITSHCIALQPPLTAPTWDRKRRLYKNREGESRRC